MKTTTTTHLISARVRWFDIPMPATIAIVIFFVLCIAGLVGRLELTSSTAAAVPTPSLPIVIIATQAAAPVPTPAAIVQVVAPAAAVRYVVGFDSPNGHALGAIPAPEAGAIVARYGNEWLQTTHDGAPIWVRASELGMNIADIAPTAAPQVVYVAQEGPQEAPQQAPVVEAAPTMAPALPAVAPQTAAILDRGQWAAMAATARAVQP